MNNEQITDAANQLTMQRFLAQYFSSQQQYATRQIAGATVVVEPSRHRTGLPADVTCRRYVLTNLGAGWSMSVRAAWRNDRLHEPAAVHCQIEQLWDDDGRHDDDERAVAAAVNRWLQGLSL